jgi:uncharacterized protein YceK
MRHINVATIAFVIFISLSACSTVESAPRAPSYKPRIGMTMSEVENSGWGAPDEYNRTKLTTRYGKTECWFYPRYNRSLCFNDFDRVVTISE